VKIKPGSWLRDTLGTDEIRVNSLHGQGLRKLGAGIERLPMPKTAWSSDSRAEHFALPVRGAVAPGWQAAKNPDSIKMFQAFGDACRARSASLGQRHQAD
jgi:putative glutamine amidotransferase